jgi:hypothetical protein
MDLLAYKRRMGGWHSRTGWLQFPLTSKKLNIQATVCGALLTRHSVNLQSRKSGDFWGYIFAAIKKGRTKTVIIPVSI